MPSRLRHRVTLQLQATTQDAAGQQSQTWSDYRSCFGDVRDTSGLEQRTQHGLVGINYTTVRIRYPREGRFPTPEDRVVFRETSKRTRYLNIDSVQEKTGTHRELMLACKEEVV
jgi:SPP1 family predicted phage head-tail adaptor